MNSTALFYTKKYMAPALHPSSGSQRRPGSHPTKDPASAIQSGIESASQMLADKILIWLWGATPFFGLSLIPIGLWYLLIYPFNPAAPGREFTGGDLVKIFAWFPILGIFLTDAMQKAEVDRGTVLTLAIGPLAVLYLAVLIFLFVILVIFISKVLCGMGIGYILLGFKNCNILLFSL